MPCGTPRLECELDIAALLGTWQRPPEKGPLLSIFLQKNIFLLLVHILFSDNIQNILQLFGFPTPVFLIVRRVLKTALFCASECALKIQYGCSWYCCCCHSCCCRRRRCCCWCCCCYCDHPEGFQLNFLCFPQQLLLTLPSPTAHFQMGLFLPVRNALPPPATSSPRHVCAQPLSI